MAPRDPMDNPIVEFLWLGMIGYAIMMVGFWVLVGVSLIWQELLAGLVLYMLGRKFGRRV